MVTIKDVAQKAGVSVATVSRVINKNASLKETTIKRVEDAIDELGYQPNTFARSLVKGRNKSIGVLIPYVNNPYWCELFYYIEKAADRYGYPVICMSTNNDVEQEKADLQILRGNMVLGILVSTSSEQENLYQESDVPIVKFEDRDGIWPCVSSDHYQGGTLATRHLISRQCKHLLHFCGNMDNGINQADKRSTAFEETCKKYGICYTMYRVDRESAMRMDYQDLVSEAFFRYPEVDGIFASNDVIAVQCIKTALALGYKIPEDIKIVGFDDVYLARMMYPEITTIRQNIPLIAEKAVMTLVHMIEGKQYNMFEQIGVHLVERKTT